MHTPAVTGRFRIGSQPWRNAIGWLGVLIVATTMTVFAFFAAVSTGLDGSTGQGFVTWAFVISVASGALVGFLGLNTLRDLIAGRGTVKVENGQLVVELGSFLAEPIVLPLEDIRFATVSSEGPSWSPATGKGAFPVYREFRWSAPDLDRDPEVLFFIFDAHHQQTPYPTKHDDEWPNLLLVFERPVEVEFAVLHGMRPRRIRATMQLPGITLRAHNLDQAVAVLSATGKLRNATESDASHIDALVDTIYGVDRACFTDTASQSTGYLPPPDEEPQVPTEITRPPRPRSSKRKGGISDSRRWEFWHALSTGTRTRLIVIGYFVVTYGFSLLLIGFSAALLFSDSSPNPWSFLLAVAGVTLAYSSIPRRFESRPEGVRLDLSRHPELTRTIGETAIQMGVEPPTNVYISMHGSAYAGAEDGDPTTIGIGIFNLALASVDELRYVIGHEIAHRDDVAMRGWLNSMVASASRLDQTVDPANTYLMWRLARAPIRAYLEAVDSSMVRISHDKEFAADAAAARVAGSDASERFMLEEWNREMMTHVFFNEYFVPAAKLGLRTPLVRGLAEFALKSEYARELREAYPADGPGYEAFLDEETRAHPPWRARAQAVGAIAASSQFAPDRRLSASLLGDIRQVEDALLRRWLGDEYVNRMRTVDWPTALDELLRVETENHRAAYGESFSRVAWSDMPAWLQNRDSLANQLGITDKLASHPWEINDPEAIQYSRDDRIAIAVQRAFGDAMTHAGWRPILTSPGNSCVWQRGDSEVRASEIMRRLRAGEMTVDEWRSTLIAMGIAPHACPYAIGAQTFTLPHASQTG